MSDDKPEVWGDGCECWVVPEHMWTTYYGAVEPGSQTEYNPECPKHGESTGRHAEEKEGVMTSAESDNILHSYDVAVVRETRALSRLVDISTRYERMLDDHALEETELLNRHSCELAVLKKNQAEQLKPCVEEFNKNQDIFSQRQAETRKARQEVRENMT